MDVILKYFPEIDGRQRRMMASLGELYREWNDRINVISRKDLDQLYLHHVLHSLSIARVCEFAPGARIVDVGCGGGFPTVPLAVLFPQAHFTAVDSIGKKIAVVRAVVDALGLANVTPVNGRAEQLPGKFDYAIGRAVTDMKTFGGWVWDKLTPGRAGSLPGGILCLKGGDLAAELAAVRKPYVLYDIYDRFPEEYFREKRVVYIPR